MAGRASKESCVSRLAFATPVHLAFKAEPVLAVADLVLSTLCLGAASAPPPFTADALSSAPGSGSAMEDWLAAVVAGGDMEGEQLEAAAAAEKDDGESDELLVPGGLAGCPWWWGLLQCSVCACLDASGANCPSRWWHLLQSIQRLALSLPCPVLASSCPCTLRCSPGQPCVSG